MNMIVDTVVGIVQEAYFLLNKMSIYLLFGFIFAGILHIFMKEGVIAKHLGTNSVGSVVKASLFGIPLPLCSCGVLPAALSLKKEGASNGAVLAFLISTPTTGVDSILATYALLGGLFATYRVIACFLAGLLAGMIGNFFYKNEPSSDMSVTNDAQKCKLCEDEECATKRHNLVDKIKGVFSYAFQDLLDDAGAWLIVGLLLGGAIAYFVPEDMVTNYLGSGFQAMVIMLLVGIPMYVCATGSIPIVASLMLKGMSPGAAFVFLMAGPATNSVALTVIAKQMGKKAVIIFIGSVIISSLALGAVLDLVWSYFDFDLVDHIMHHSATIPAWLEVGASIFLITAIIMNTIRKKAHHTTHP
ncbi:MAG: SO_0444 family Cu/Zn efflux transporter [Candidatus Omnitrophica bacterium]|nr:SO_0444 family Cu/Zn efflux transporter [Candidatus Omnitrophota bacterium]